MSHRIHYLLDGSGSMHSNIEAVKRLVTESISKLPKGSLVTISDFDTEIREHVRDKKSPFKWTGENYRARGGTALRDSVAASCVESDENDTHLLVILTDGAENQSTKVSAKDFKALLNKLQKTDRWTFAWMVPRGDKQSVIDLGIDKGNVMEWDKISEAANALNVGTEVYTTALVAGRTHVKAGFFKADLTGVKKAEIRAAMKDITAQCLRAKVTERMPIKAFCEKKFKMFSRAKGDIGAYYELIETETVQDYKQIILIDNRRPKEIFIGGREILGLPAGDVRLKPGEHGNYRIFVRSTSTNRNLDVNTEVIFNRG